MRHSVSVSLHNKDNKGWGQYVLTEAVIFYTWKGTCISALMLLRCTCKVKWQKPRLIQCILRESYFLAHYENGGSFRKCCVSLQYESRNFLCCCYLKIYNQFIPQACIDHTSLSGLTCAKSWPDWLVESKLERYQLLQVVNYLRIILARLVTHNYL